MEMTEFQNKVEKALSEYGGPEYTVKISRVNKNNGIVLTGVSLCKPGCSITPTIYIDDYLKKYEEGMSFGSIIKEITDIINNSENAVEFDVSEFTEWKKAETRIAFKLISSSKNEQLLKEIPSVPFLDMSIVFYYLIGEKYFGNASILVRNTHMECWGIDTDILYSAAVVNTRRILKPQLQDMGELMKDIFMEDIKRKLNSNSDDIDRNGAEQIARDVIDDMLMSHQSVPMYILTNKNKYFGAAGMVYTDILGKFAEDKDSNIFILPSSVHEVILLPDMGYENADELKEMVSEVNRTQLSPDEVLSDSVYYYDRSRGDISVLRGEGISAIA
ncbi:MAG: hypothetical protein J6X66_08985 [Lachnospiraceae bacterium]|nr:hypothetical protein [Lachnospiraceae bacterium]